MHPLDMRPQQILGGKVLVAVATLKVFVLWASTCPVGGSSENVWQHFRSPFLPSLQACVSVGFTTRKLPLVIHLALVHEALVTELPAAPRLGTVHSLLVSVELHAAVKHLTTQCTMGLQTMIPPLGFLPGHCIVEELVTRET